MTCKGKTPITIKDDVTGALSCSVCYEAVRFCPGCGEDLHESEYLRGCIYCPACQEVEEEAKANLG